LEGETFTINENYENVCRELADVVQARDFYKQELERMSVDLALKNREILEKV
jgi:hypothetical protein